MPDYLEATIFSRDMGVIMVGTFEDVDSWEKWWQVPFVWSESDIG